MANLIMKTLLLLTLILFSEVSFSQNLMSKNTNRVYIVASTLLLRTITSLSTLGDELPLIANYLFRSHQIIENPLKILILDRLFSDEESILAILDLFLSIGYKHTIVAVQSIIDELFETYYDVNIIPDQAIIDKLDSYL